jgi:hypothetical protein
VSLEVQQEILKIVTEAPSYGPKRICQVLGGEEHGRLDVQPRKVYECLKRLRLSTKEQRVEFASDGGRKIMDLDVEERQEEATEIAPAGESVEETLEAAPIEEAVHSGTQQYPAGEDESK